MHPSVIADGNSALFKQEIIIGFIEDTAADSEPVLYHFDMVFQIIGIHSAFIHQPGGFACGGIEPDLIGKEALIPQDRHVLAIGEGVRTGQKPGIIPESPQIQNRGQNVHAAHVGIHINRLFHAANPEDQRGFILVGSIDLIAQQLSIPPVAQAVGMVIRCQDNGRLLQDPCCIQLFHQIRQRLIQLNIAGQIALAGFTVGQILHQVIILISDLVGLGIIADMAGESHIVGMELLSGMDIIPNGLLHHFQI